MVSVSVRLVDHHSMPAKKGFFNAGNKNVVGKNTTSSTLGCHAMPSSEATGSTAGQPYFIEDNKRDHNRCTS